MCERETYVVSNDLSQKKEERHLLPASRKAAQDAKKVQKPEQD